VTSFLKPLFSEDVARRAAALSIAMNAVLMVLKLSVGVVSGSIAVLSDGIDSLEDIVAAGITYASLHYGARPPDTNHPYGHGRAETLAASFQGMLIGIGGLFILWRAVERIVDPPDHIGTGIGIAVMLVAAAANLALVQYTGRVARMTGSPAIASEARHLWTNVVQAGAVTTGLVVVAITGAVELDGVIAFGLGLYLLWIAGKILWSSAADVLDSSLDAEDVAAIEAAIREAGGPEHAVYGLRTRRAGQVRHIDFNMTLPGEMTVDESHAIADRVEARLDRLYPGSVVTIHIEPRDRQAENAGL
jgi:cation diffusion facilitator family transporter